MNQFHAPPARRLTALAVLLALAVAGAPSVVATQPQADDSKVTVDAGLPRYERLPEAPKGKVRIAGGSVVAAILDRQGDGFTAVSPGVTFDVRSLGAKSSLSDLLTGDIDIAGMSRPLNSQERAAFKTKFGYEPTELVIGFDALAIFVNKQNPIKGMTLAEVASVFGDTAAGTRVVAKKWGDLKLTGEFETLSLIVYGFSVDNGGATMLKEVVLNGGNFRDDLKGQPASGAIVNGVGAEKGGVGYASQSFRTNATKIVPLAASAGQPFVEPTSASVTGGTYPLSRKLHVVVNRKPGTPLPLPTQEFLKYVLSKQGQEILVNAGSFPIPAAMASAQATSLK